MIFKTKAEAKAYVEANGGRFYHGHRGYVVIETPPEYQAGDKVEDEKSKVLIGDGTPIW